MTTAQAEADRRFPPDHEVPDPHGATGVARSDEYGYDEVQNRAFVAGAEWADAQRESLTDVTREELAEVIGSAWDEDKHTALEWADVILAEYRPVVSARERLAKALGATLDWTWNRSPGVPSADEQLLGIAGDLLASDAVEDRTKVERASAEKAWDAAISEARAVVNRRTRQHEIDIDLITLPNPHRVEASA